LVDLPVTVVKLETRHQNSQSLSSILGQVFRSGLEIAPKQRLADCRNLPGELKFRRSVLVLMEPIIMSIASCAGGNGSA